MVNTTESSSNHHSPPMTAVPPESDSPKFPRKNLPSPWAQVVRGAEPESTAGTPQSPPPPPPSSASSSSSLAASVASVPEQLPSSDSSSPKAVAVSPPVDNRSVVAAPPDSSDGGEGNAGRSKKPAWNKPSNGVVSEAGLVMGGSWPALSESTKGTPKLAAEPSSKTALDASLSTSQGPVTSNSPQRQATSHAKPNSATTYNIPNRQRPMKRGGGSSVGSGPSSSGFPNVAPPPPPFPVYPVPAPAIGYGNVMPGAPDHSPRDHYRRNTWDARPPVGNFVPPMTEHRGSSRRGNFGSHPRGDGSYHNNYGSRRDHDRANYGNARDAHVHQPGGILRHPPPNAPSFVNPAHVGSSPYANHMGFHGPDLLYVSPVQVDPMRSMPFFPSTPTPPSPPPPPTMFFHAETSSPLNNMIIKQIEYYFSDANLVKDEYLRSNMDEQGWVPITLIANFPRGDKLRRHNEWMRWLPAAHLRSDSSSISTGGPNFNNLAANFQTITLEEAAKIEGTVESSGVTQISNGDDSAALVNKN
ncbi:la-related protein 1C isoform X2 [Arachis ipaensis]|uniref:la-related protein 1C isoform X2 n=1 Tax=Arachis ipaensis TaxID=130454 RepID=UPI000A2B0069|nr:la-related protein 1C isoform X2 [Arachis ipaensis]